MNVLVYTGPGTARGSADWAVRTLRLLATRYDVVPVDAAALAREPWQHTAALLVVPGGRDLPYVEHLAPLGTKAVRDWVNAGGRYLGICAGAYFAAARVDFVAPPSSATAAGSTTPAPQPTHHVPPVSGTRDLGFFPGAARGSVTPGFQYDSDTGARAVEVVLDLGTLSSEALPPPPPPLAAGGTAMLRMYCNGGPYFARDDDINVGGGGVVTLATYAGGPEVVPDAVGQPAIVMCDVGAGRAILVGPHIEFGDAAVGSESERVSSDEARHWLFSSILLKLGLE
ncbi:biotin holocarboxylase synthetase, partial [Cladochytrium tenue]